MGLRMTYTAPVVTILNDHEFELVQPFAFQWEDSEGVFQITIPKGYPFDGASVPRACWSLTGLLPTGVHMGAAAVHDWLYQRRGYLNRGELLEQQGDQWVPVVDVWTRQMCDDLFLRIMQAGGVTPWKAKAMHWAVRVFGGRAWNQ